MAYEPLFTTQIPIGTPLTFTFDEPVVVAADGISARRSGTFEAIPFTYSLSPDQCTLTVRPTVTPPLRLAIDFPGVRDQAGNVTPAQLPDFNYPVWLGHLSPQLDTDTDTSQPAIALDGEGRPVLAWCEDALQPKLFVHRREGNGWTALGGGALNVDAAGGVTRVDPALAARGSHLVVAWEEIVVTTRTLHVRRWTGSAWAQLAGTPPTGTVSDRIHLALRADGSPVLGLLQGYHFHVFVHDGSGWAELGNLAEADVEHFDPVLALGPDDVPYVAYVRSQISTGATTAQVRKWNATTTAWDTIAGSPHQFATGFTVDANGQPWVAYKASADDLVTSHWTGSGWTTPQRLNGVIHTRVTIRDPRMAIEPDGTVVVVWVDNEYELWVARRAGTEWKVAPRAVNPTQNLQYTKDFSFAAGVTGPWVAFTDTLGKDLFVSQLNR